MGLAAPDGDDEGEAGGKGTAATPLSAMNRKDPSRVGVQLAKTRAAVRGAIQRWEAGEGVASGKRATAVKVWGGEVSDATCDGNSTIEGYHLRKNHRNSLPTESDYAHTYTHA